MANIRCTTCGDTLDSREVMACCGCGAVMCAGCAAGSRDLCNYCYGDLKYYS